jgi:hypothetical protein
MAASPATLRFPRSARGAGRYRRPSAWGRRGPRRCGGLRDCGACRSHGPQLCQRTPPPVTDWRGRHAGTRRLACRSCTDAPGLDRRRIRETVCERAIQRKGGAKVHRNRSRHERRLLPGRVHRGGNRGPAVPGLDRHPPRGAARQHEHALAEGGSAGLGIVYADATPNHAAN